MDTNKNINNQKTNIIISKSDLYLVDKFKAKKGFPTRTLAIRQLVELGFEYDQLKEKVTDSQISKLIS